MQNSTIPTTEKPEYYVYPQVGKASFLLHPTLCPAGYVLVSTNLNIRGLECQCDPNIVYKLIIHCESDQDKIIVEVFHYINNIIQYSVFLSPRNMFLTGGLLGNCCS